MKLPFPKCFILLIAAALLIMMIPCASGAEEGTHIVILATSDLHGNIWSYSYMKTAGPIPAPGSLRTTRM